MTDRDRRAAVRPTGTPFDPAIWGPMLEKYGAVTHLSVGLYDAQARLLWGPGPPTPILGIFQQHDYDPGVLLECANQCLAQTAAGRTPVIYAPSYGLAAVGTALVLDGTIVAAAVAGYAFVDFTQSADIERLARDAGVPFRQLWDVARQEQPVPARRFVLYAELLQLLGDTLLRENFRTRLHEETSAQLVAAAAAKDDFLAVLSHELRSPLTPILGWSQMLKAATDPAKIARGAEAIERNVLLQIRLVDDLLDLNRVKRGKVALDLRVHCLSDVARSALEALAPSADAKGVAMHLLDVDERLCVEADGDRLQQIVRNVLSNAVKYTPPGGSVTLAISREDPWAVLRLTDTGQGIAPEFLPFAFEMFRQQQEGARRNYMGLGIGLSLVKELVESHGGTVTIASEGIGRGAEVTIRLPLVDEPAAAAGMLDRLEGLRVLVVDDMSEARDWMCAALEQLGARVVTAANGIEALRVVVSAPVDLVLCDLQMPAMDGFEFLFAIDRLEGHEREPVVAVSGFTDSADHLRAQAAGFDGYLDRPFDDAQLLAIVSAALARRRFKSSA